MKSILHFVSIFCSFCLTAITAAQAPLTPEQFFSRTAGEAFTPHHKVVDYCIHVASESEQAELVEYGTTPEGRPLQVLIFSSSQNLNQLDELRKEHLDPTATDFPVIWLSYDVHGNEAVCTEAAVELIGKLAQGGQEVDAWLDKMFIIVDPCLNPDGHERYVNFFNGQVGAEPNPDPNSSQHDEPWPGGRYNHYLYDLNRDWAWLVQPESQARWNLYAQWMPHVHGDFHEMGYNSPYYFPPAVEPYHEVITDWQRAFQWEIGQATSANFDNRGELYYTDEDFDLFYPSYGDTYPLYHGAIGMTYEQGGSGAAGLAVERADGSILTLADRIENHVESSWVLIQTSFRLREQLTAEFREWQRVNLAGEGADYAGYLFPLADQTQLLPDLQAFLTTHGIEVFEVTGSVQKPISGRQYTNGKWSETTPRSGDLWIPAAGTHGRFLQVLMDPEPKLSDSLTYDITAWALPYAHGLEAWACIDAPTAISPLLNIQPEISLSPDAFGWAVPIQGPQMGRFLAAAFQAELEVLMCSEAIGWPGMNLGPGTPIIRRSTPQTTATLEDVLSELGLSAQEIPGGLTSEGPDLGSEKFRSLKGPRVACLTGSPCSATGVGAVWSHFELDLGYPLTRLNFNSINVEMLSEYDICILPSGWYGGEEDAMNALKEYAQNGGWIIGLAEALPAWVNSFGGLNSVMLESSGDEPVLYADESRDRARGRIEGAVYKTDRDATHPLSWSTPGPYFSLQNSSRRFARAGSRASAAIWIEGQSEPLAGFAGERLIPTPEDLWIAGSWSVGGGGVALFGEDPLFRGFWSGGKTLFNQAVFILPSFE